MSDPISTQSSAAPEAGAAAASPAQPAANAPAGPASSSPAAAAPAAAAPAEQQQPTPAAAAPAAAPAAGTPETYEFKAPQGTEVGAPVLTAFSDVARELGLPQDGAQKVLDKVAPAIAAHQAAQLEAFYQDIGGLPTTWEDAARKDAEYGGPAFEQNLAVTQKAIALGTPELKALLNKTGLGNHPEMVRWMYRVGKHFNEDAFVTGQNSSVPTAPSAAQRMYPNMNP